jgi:thymidylate kinase
MTVLIIEGPDLAGKGFAIEKIAKSFRNGFLIKNLYKPHEHTDSKIYKQYWAIMKMCEKQEFIILDRFFPSQAVYSYMRGEDEMKSSMIALLDEECTKKGYIYVYLDTTLENLENRFDQRGDEHIQRKDLMKLRQRYNKFWQQTNMPKIKIDTTKLGWLERLQDFVKEVEHEHKRRRKC